MFDRIDSDSSTDQPIADDAGRVLASLRDDVVSTTLPVSAAEAYQAFCDVEASPQWVSIVKSVSIAERTAAGLASRAAFLGQLKRAPIEYTLQYWYDDARRRVTWSTAAGARVAVAGHAEFIPLGDRACLVQYQLQLDLPGEGGPRWDDSFFDGHLASVVVNDFRDFITRNRRH